MAAIAKVVLTDYVWESLEVEKTTLAGLADHLEKEAKQSAPSLLESLGAQIAEEYARVRAALMKEKES